MKDKIIAIITIIALTLSVGITFRMEGEITKQKQTLEESRQALLTEQKEIQNRIENLQEQYEKLQDMYLSQGIHLSNIRDRLNMDLFRQLEEGEDW